MNLKALGYILLVVATVAMILLKVSAQSIDVMEGTLSLTIDRGETKTLAFTVQNNGASPANLTFTHDLDLTDNDGDEITLAFSDPGEIQPGTNATVTMTFDADSRIDFETYAGTVTVTDAVSGESDTFSLTVIVEPNICSNGVAGSSLIATIENPDENDDFKPGNTINMKVNVKNVGDDDIQARVDAFLFSDNAEVTDASSATKNIENGDDDDFSFPLVIPLDARKIDEDNSYFIIVKAFDDDNENSNCATDRISIDMKLDSKDIAIDEESTGFFPAIAQCGEGVMATVKVINIGSKDNNRVQVIIENQELGISESSGTFSMNAFSAEDDNAEIVQFLLEIPEDAQVKTYPFQLTVNHDSGKETGQLLLSVMSCDTISSSVSQGKDVVSLSLLTESVQARQGEQITIPLVVRNDLETMTIFSLSLTNTNEIGQGAIKSIVLEPHQQGTVFMDFIVNPDAVEGTQTAIIEVRSGSTLVATEALSMTITSTAIKKGSTADALPLELWIIIDVLIAALLIIIGYLMLAKKK